MLKKLMLEECLKRLEAEDILVITKTEASQKKEIQNSKNFMKQHEVELLEYFLEEFTADLERALDKKVVQPSYAYSRLLATPKDELAILNRHVLKDCFQKYIRNSIPEKLKNSFSIEVIRQYSFPPCYPPGTVGFEFVLNFNISK